MCDLDVPAEQTHSVELELGISNIANNNNTVCPKLFGLLT